MEAIEKTITVFRSIDGVEFLKEEECIKHENMFLRKKKEQESYSLINELHKKLLLCDFHGRYKIIPYFHNREIKFIGGKYTENKLSKDYSYMLMGGRMGNGDDRVRYKIRSDKSILLLKYNTDDSDFDKQEYFGKIPYFWINLSQEDLQKEVDEYISKRKIFVKEVSFTPSVTYKEI